MRAKYRFYRKWVQIIKGLYTQQERLLVINAISDYLLYGHDTFFENPFIQSTWNTIKDTVEFKKEARGI